MKLLSDRAVLVSSMICGISLLTICYYWVHAERRKFERHVLVGQTAEEVRSLVGDPQKVLLPGEELAKWGNAPGRSVTDPTWVYFVYPKSLHRFVITLRRNKVAEIEYTVN